jgi:hypothetical protein
MHEPNITLNPQETGYLIDGTPAFGKCFTKAMNFHYPEGLAAVADDEGAYHITFDGKPLYAQRHLESYGYYGGLATVRSEKGFFHIDMTGNPAYQTRYAWAGNFQEGLCVVKTADGYCHIDTRGNPVYAQRYWYVGDFKHGIAVAHSADGAFHIRPDGKRLNSAVYRDADPFHKGYAVVSDESGYFHIGKEGQPSHPYRFRRAEPYYNGISRCLTHDGRQVLLRENGFYTHVSQANARMDVSDLPSVIRSGHRAALYIRHGERSPRPRGQWGDDIQLTPKGIADAKEFGTLLRDCGECAFHSSPVGRCRQTALVIAEGMLGREITPDALTVSSLLGSPGPFNDLDNPGHFAPDEFSAVADRYIESGFHVGLKPLSQACEGISEYLKSSVSKPLNIFATHDFFVAGMQRYLGLRHPKNGDWIEYLEGVCMIEDGSPHGKWVILNGWGEQKTC